MTWWMIGLIVLGYVFIAGLLRGITSNVLGENALYVSFFWPLVLPAFVLLLLAYLPYKLGEWIFERLKGFKK